MLLVVVAFLQMITVVGVQVGVGALVKWAGLECPGAGEVEQVLSAVVVTQVVSGMSKHQHRFQTDPALSAYPRYLPYFQQKKSL